MKRNDLSEVKKMEVKALKAKVSDLKAKLTDLNLDKGAGKLKSSRAIFNLRKEIATYMTVLNQRLTLEKIEALNVSEEGGSK